MRAKWALFFLLLCPSPLWACDWLDVAVSATHFNGRDYNEDGPLVGCELGRYHVRYFKNSHDWDTWAITGTIELPGPFGLEFGAVHGYRNKLPQIADDVAPWITLKATMPIGGGGRISCHLLAAEAVACIFSIRGWN